MLPAFLAIATQIPPALSINGNLEPIRVGGTLCHPRNLLVKIDGPARTKQLAAVGVTVLRTMPEIGYAVVEAPVDSLIKTRALLAKQPGVLRVDLDCAARLAYTPNDPYWPNQWHSRAIKADLAWDTTKGIPGVIVAVIDTGVDMTHPDLAANLWTNPGDGVHGWDFVNNDNNPTDDAGHGTSCAGLAAGIQDNSLGITGVAPHCRIMAMKAANSGGFFYNSATVPAYLYAADHGAKVFSMSYFADSVAPAEEAGLQYAVAHGVLPVAAAGNDNTVYTFYPGAYECVLSVAAVNMSLGKASFSDFGSWVDVSCPGTSLAATTMGGGYTTTFAGTSGSCPQVAGVAALCFSANVSATPEMVRNAIEDTATLQNQAPFGEFSNYGLVDTQAAVLRMLGGSAPTKAAVVRWVTPLSSGPPPVSILNPLAVTTSRFYGRGFGTGHVVRVMSSGRSLPILSKTRDYVDVLLPGRAVPLTVFVDGSLVATIPPTGLVGKAWPMSEASTDGATLTGGFYDTLAVDAKRMTVTRRSDGMFLVEGTFHLVGSPSTMKLTFRRQYTGTTVGTETLSLYDWTTASYPYGSFTTIATTSVPTVMTTGTWTVPNPTRYADFNGTILFQLTTSTNITSGAQLLIDQAALSQ